ncbi:MAG: DUF1579 domain-containing protein [Phycisphaeraceae bacterium]|nr:DUF1579 domain-containing protein [Phycisphaeraceae bacterium]MCW5754580.1 DUF1579 domain-containing protein [Phycisphaeraceae bacterium]
MRIAARSLALVTVGMLTGSLIGASILHQPEVAPPADMAEFFAQYSAPDKHHNHLKSLVGTWDSVMSFRMDPDAPEMQSRGTMVTTELFEGRFIQQDFKGDFLGQPFFGRSTMGFSKPHGEYQCTWIDNMSTTIYFSSGECSADGKRFTLNGKELDPMTNQPLAYRDVITILDDNRHRMVRTYIDADGAEAEGFRIEYTRRR